MQKLKQIINWQFRRTTTVVVICLALLLGIGLAKMQRAPSISWLLVGTPIVWFLLPRRRWGALLLAALVAFGFGVWRGENFARRLIVYDQLSQQKVTLVGTADSDAVYGKNYQLAFTLKQAEIQQPYPAKLTGTLSIAGFGEPAIYRGDRIVVTGKLYKTRGNNLAGISYATLHVTQRNMTPIDNLRRKFAAGLQTALPEPLASFGMGLLVGQRNTLPDDVSHTLLVVGLTHIIAVSGYNLTIILRASGKMLANRSKYQYMCCSVGLMFLFLTIAGLSPSIVRASVVSGLGLAAWWYGRKVKPLVLLLLSAAITGWANPVYVWGNISWYLSFLAFFGVLVLAPLVTYRLFRGREPNLVIAVVIESLCAEVMTLPYVLHIFGQMSLVAIPANVLVVALVPLAMLLVMVAGLAGMLISPIVGWFAWPAKLLLTYMLDVAELLSRIPSTFREHIGLSTAMMAASYGTVLFLIIILHTKVGATMQASQARQTEAKLV